MYNYSIAIKELEKAKAKQGEGYEYVYNSELTGEEEQVALATIRHKMKSLEAGIEALTTLSKF